MTHFTDLVGAVLRQPQTDWFHTTTTGTAGNDTLYSNSHSQWLDGGDGNDNLVASNDGSTMFGGNGNDNFFAGKGADYMNGGAGFDYVQYTSAESGVWADLGDSSRNTGDAKGDTYVSIEGLVGSSHDDVLMGDAGNNALYGGLGNDYLYGGAGNDWLHGGKGDDVLNGGDGNDHLYAEGGNDHLTGGAGADTFHFDQSSEGFRGIIIRDFNTREDTIDLHGTTFGNQTPVYGNGQNGWFFDSDREGTGTTLFEKINGAVAVEIHVEHVDPYFFAQSHFTH